MCNLTIVSIDLAHPDRLEKALTTGAELARHFKPELYGAGVTGLVQGLSPATPEDYAPKLERFAKEQSEKSGVTFHPKAMKSVDVAIEIDDALE